MITRQKPRWSLRHERKRVTTRRLRVQRLAFDLIRPRKNGSPFLVTNPTPIVAVLRLAPPACGTSPASRRQTRAAATAVDALLMGATLADAGGHGRRSGARPRPTPAPDRPSRSSPIDAGRA